MGRKWRGGPQRNEEYDGKRGVVERRGEVERITKLWVAKASSLQVERLYH